MGTAGMSSCILPRAIFFNFNRHTALTGKQLLLLQGAQRDTAFGNETQKQIQDLAGNAMSTTVIAAALTSALTAGRGYFKSAPDQQSRAIEKTWENPT